MSLEGMVAWLNWDGVCMKENAAMSSRTEINPFESS